MTWALPFLAGFALGCAVTSEIWRRVFWRDFQAAMRDLRAYEKLLKLRLQEGEEDGLRQRSE